MGWLVDQCLHHVPLSRLLVAGGDTAGRVLRQLDFGGAKVIGRDFAPGVSLLNLFKFEDETSLPALLKGGQAGALTFFEDARLGVVRAGVPSRSSFASGQAEQLEG